MPKSECRASTTSALRHPVFLGLAGADDDRGHGPVDLSEELALPDPLVLPGPQVPCNWLRRDAELAQELEVLILNVLWLMGRNPPVGEEPVEVTRPLTIEAELDRRLGERRHQSGLEVDLEGDDEVERTLLQLRANVGEGGEPLRSIEFHDLIDRRMAAHERGWTGLQHPCEA
jgi:hypothetical protein